MPAETNEERAERQARLSRAMGAMFLQDKVERLERDVQRVPLSRTMTRSKSGPNHSRRLGQSNASPSNPEANVRIASRSATRSSQSPARPSPPVKFVLIDASVLIYSLRTVHEWLKDASIRMVIPLEAINTLDLLKKGNDPVNVAARKATRFLEERMQAAHPSPGAQLAQGRSAGLFCQQDSERASQAALEDRRRSIQVAQRADTNLEDKDPLEADESEPEEDAYAIRSSPRFIRELLSAALYLEDQLTSRTSTSLDGSKPGEMQSCSVAICKADQTAGSDPEGESLPFSDRADGRISAQWLEAYGLNAETVPIGKSWQSTLGGRTDAKGPSVEAPPVTERPTSANDATERTQLDVGVVRKPAPVSAAATQPASMAHLTSAQHGSISILKSRGPNGSVNFSQESFHSQGTSVGTGVGTGTGTGSPRFGSRNASMTSLCRLSMEMPSSAGEEEGSVGGGGGGASVRSSRTLNGSRKGMADPSSRKTAAERMEEYVRSLS